MTTNPPGSTEARLRRLETLFAGMGETVVAHDNTIDRMVRNIQQLTENVNAVNQRVDSLAEQAAADRQQAAIDRHKAAINHQVTLAEIQRIWQSLLDRNLGNGTTGE